MNKNNAAEIRARSWKKSEFSETIQKTPEFGQPKASHHQNVLVTAAADSILLED